MDLIYLSSVPSLGGKRSTWKSYSIPLTLVAMAATMSVVSIVLSAIVWERSRSLTDEVRRIEGQAPRSSGVCLPCSTILDASSSIDDIMMSEIFFTRHGFDSSSREDGTDIRNGDKETCCAKGGYRLRMLLRMFLEIRSRKERDEGTREKRRCLVFPSVETSANGTSCIREREVDAAQLTGTGPGSDSGATPSQEDGGFNGILDWANPNVLHGRLVNSHGRLTIGSTGIYFVYSQIYFVEYEEDYTKTSNGSVSVYINRFINETKQSEVLTERAEGRCSRSTLTSASLCEYTLYAGSLVQLATGDSVYVTVSHPSMVNDDAKITYFGLQKVT